MNRRALRKTVMCMMMGIRYRPSSYEVRHDPDRPKDDEDLAKMEKARLKRERKQHGKI